MNPPPDGLEVHWADQRAEVVLYPLRKGAERWAMFNDFAVVWVLTTLLLIPVFAMGWITLHDPMLSVIAAATLGVVASTGMLAGSLRRRGARLDVRMTRQQLELSHTIGGVGIHSEELPWSSVAEVEYDRQTLVLRLRDGSVLREPLPAIPEAHGAWLADALRHQCARSRDDAQLDPEAERQLRALQQLRER